MIKYLTFLLFWATQLSADQNRDAYALARAMNVAALPPSTPIHPTETTSVVNVAITNCTLQVQATYYSPQTGEVRFANSTLDIGAMAFETENDGKRFTFADYENEPNRGRLNYRVTPPDARLHNQTHPLDLDAPLRAAIPTAWVYQGTFGLGSFIIEGNITEADMTAIISAFDAYQANYCR